MVNYGKLSKQHIVTKMILTVLLSERDSGYCLRPDVVKAHTKEVSKGLMLFLPCSGVAHSIFEIQTPSGIFQYGTTIMVLSNLIMVFV